MFYVTVVTTGNLTLGKLGIQVHKNHFDFHAYWGIIKLKINNLFSILANFL